MSPPELFFYRVPTNFIIGKSPLLGTAGLKGFLLGMTADDRLAGGPVGRGIAVPIAIAALHLRGAHQVVTLHKHLL